MGKREGNGGTRGRGDKAEREREEGKRYRGEGKEEAEKQGEVFVLYVGIVGERQMESKRRNCRNSTRGKGKDMEGIRGNTRGTT